jgi:hypothetical protein
MPKSSRPKLSSPKSSSHLSPKDSSVGMEDSTAVQQHSDTNSLLSTTSQPERQNDPGVDEIHDNSNTLLLPTDNKPEWESRLSTFAAITHNNVPFPRTEPTINRRMRRLAIFGPIEARTQSNGDPFPTPQTKRTETRSTRIRRRIRRPRKSLSLFTLETMDSARIDTDTRLNKRPRTG